MSRPDASDRAELNLPNESTIEFLVRFARVAHRAGYPTADLEERLGSLAVALGLEGAQISATPTLVELSFGSLPRQRSYTLRVRPTPVDLDAIARLEDLARDVSNGRLTVGAAVDRLEKIETSPLERPWYVELAAYSLAGGAVTPVLGGSWREVVAGGIVGLLVGVVGQLTRRTARAEPMAAPLAAVVASFSAAAIAWNASSDTVTLAALVTFLPGMAVFATPDWRCSVASSRTPIAFVTAMAISYGLMVSTLILPPRLMR